MVIRETPKNYVSAFSVKAVVRLNESNLPGVKAKCLGRERHAVSPGNVYFCFVLALYR